MERIVIEGGRKLCGETVVQGSKNSALPILAATVLCRGETVLHNCPKLTDIDAAINILRHLGCKIKYENDALIIDSSVIERNDIPEKLMHEMRSSIVFLGPLLGRVGSASLYTPGGCEIGLRPIDLHIKAIREFGISVKEKAGKIDCCCQRKITGAKITLSFPSVGATENAVLTAVCSNGKTEIINAAREPEIVDLANFLNSCGGKIHGAGEGTITVEGTEKLHGCEYTVVSDRIVCATYMAAAGVTGGRIKLKNAPVDHITPVIPLFNQSGCILNFNENNIEIASPSSLNSFGTVRTLPYPGFPTDFQAPAMAMSTVAKGTSVFIETIFESRYKHVHDLVKMGADIKVENSVAIVEGVEKLYGAKVSSTDLRGGSALVIAGLCAVSETEIFELKHIDRGYENIVLHLKELGADIKRDELIEKRR